MSNNTKYESKAITTQIKATSRVSAKTFCVYAHKSPNNKLYFGLTSLNPEHRWHNNGKGYKDQQLFYRAIKKYGWENFEHFIIAKNLEFAQACQLEKDLIAMFKTTGPKFGYNNTIGGEGSYGYKHTDKAKLKISRSTKKNRTYINLLLHRPDRRKKCALVDKKGKVVYSFNSVTECAEKLGINITTVSRNLKKNGSYGYLKFKEVN